MPSRILIIDDNQELLDIYQQILEPEGLDVQVSLSPFENLTDIEHLKFDLIILDYHLNSRVNEEPFLQRLKAYSPTASLPVIISTADERAMRKQKTALKEQGVRVILKPFDIDDLLQIVYQTLQERK